LITSRRCARRAARTSPIPCAPRRRPSGAAPTASPCTCARTVATSRTPTSARSAPPCARYSISERRQEITTEGGLALGGATPKIRTAIARLTAAGIRVSLFIDPDPGAIDRAAALGVAAVELHTGRYARSWRKSDAALRALERAAAHARGRSLAVHAGHGLTYDNVQPVAALRDIEELNIGHSIVSHAIFLGMEEAVRRMRQLVDEARRP